jgi:Domain of unknown function (DUF4276)
MTLTLGCIVEGRADELALPVLLRRIVRAIDPAVAIRVASRRITKSRLIRPGELERQIETLTRQIGRNSPVFVLIDADRDCPKTLAPNLSRRCRAAHADVDVSIVVAKCEYEAWFIAAASSLAGKRNLTTPLSSPSDPEEIRGAKEWLTAHMVPGHIYVETRDQPAFSELMDLSEARTSRSFRKLEKEVRRQVILHLDPPRSTST